MGHNYIKDQKYNFDYCSFCGASKGEKSNLQSCKEVIESRILKLEIECDNIELRLRTIISNPLTAKYRKKELKRYIKEILELKNKLNDLV